jgi:hypothetical protein
MNNEAMRAVVERYKQQRSTERQMMHSVPSKRSIKTGVSKASPRKDNEEMSKHPGGNGEYGMLKMIHSAHTGCEVANIKTLERLTRSAKNCNTTTFVAGR